MKTARKAICTVLVIVMLVSAFAFTVSARGIAYGAGTVTASILNIRSGPGMEHGVVSTVRRGAVVVIQELTNGDWYSISYNGIDGYVSSRYIGNVLTAENFSATGQVNANSVRMRSGPSTDTSILGMYNSGTQMQVIGINNGWYKVVYYGLTGYIRSDLFEITADGYNPPSYNHLSNPKGQEIANYALQFNGYSYVYGAHSPSVGFDCSGLVYYVFGQFGYSMQRGASSQYRENGYKIDKSELQPGDIVFFSDDGMYSVTHVGIYIGDNQFIHASNSRTGVIISDLGSSYYMSVWYGAKRMP